MSSMVVVSDLHLGDGSGAEDFRNEERLLELFDRVERDRCHLVLLGDVFELWQSNLAKIMFYHQRVLRRLFDLATQTAVTYVVGNHDSLPFSQYCGCSWGGIRVEPELEVAEGSVWLAHGNVFDPFNRDAGADSMKVSIGQRISAVVGIMERYLGPDVDDRLGHVAARYLKPLYDALADRRNAEALARKYVTDSYMAEANADPHSFKRQVVSIQGRYSPGHKGYVGDWHEYKDGTLGRLRERRLRVGVLGHTHAPEVVCEKGLFYVNTGSWCHSEREPTYAVIDSNSVKLYYALKDKEVEPVSSD